MGELARLGARVQAYDPVAMKGPVIFDGRNLYAPALMRSLGIVHLGWGGVVSPDDGFVPTF